jgi:glycosyltransferase involved in cell wall biosynthesis
MKALCVLSNLLGNSVTASLLRQTLDRLPGLEPTYVFVEGEDYGKIGVPRWARATDPWEVEFIARQKARQALARPFDILLVHGWEMAVAFRAVAARVPSAAVMDTVPARIDFFRRRQGLGGWKRSLSHQVHHRAFARAVRAFDLFLPQSSDCAASLERDYSIPGERCFVTLAPRDLDVWKPGAKSAGPPLRLLFVGNDFSRKGGHFLLRVYAEHLVDICNLKVVSNDPALEGIQLPPGASWLRGLNREQVLDAYQNSDLFLFPSQQDYAPQVLSEAFATGLPCLVNDIDGVRGLVQGGETGFVFSHDASAEAWAERVKQLVADPAKFSSMSAAARRFAEEKLSIDRFEKLVADVIGRLGSEITRGKFPK